MRGARQRRRALSPIAHDYQSKGSNLNGARWAKKQSLFVGRLTPRADVPICAATAALAEATNVLLLYEAV
jgi:hypothetical protein